MAKTQEQKDIERMQEISDRIVELKINPTNLEGKIISQLEDERLYLKNKYLRGL